LLATKKIKPDPAQHRLALHLQKLYFRLKDYAPEVEYRYRLDRITRDLSRHSRPRRHAAETAGADEQKQKQKQKQSQSRAVLSSLLSIKPSAFLTADTLALTRTTPLHDSALSIPSPKGMLLYGEVGRGKSMLLDMLYDSLPSRKKRRWHFNTFMLDLFRRIELARLDGLDGLRNNPRRSLFGGAHAGDHVVLSLAKDTIAESPILFLDEFQMPDRVAAKLINGFFTAFFHLGGVLVASSNRMPEELSKAAGVEFGGMPGNGNRWGREAGGARGGFFGLGWGLSRESEGEKAAKTDFGLFLDVLRARCEVWEMEGERDWRREGDDAVQVMDGREGEGEGEGEKEPGSEQDDAALEEDTWSLTTATTLASSTTPASSSSSPLSSDSPAHYHVSTPGSSDDLSSFEDDVRALNPSATWHPANLTVYARPLAMRTTHKRILKASFHDLCAVYLGPADYVSLCSTFHTLILTDVPVLTAAHKNEARRFITLLDALYEARCRLVIHADAPPDKLFFPDTRTRSAATLSTADGMLPVDNDDDDDSITSEAFSEIYQDSTAPFRPNITTYTEGNTRSSTPRSFPPSSANPSVRTVLADEDADFGPTYGNGRGHGISNSDSGVAEAHGMAGPSPDFTNTSALTGEDERFAYKRARSRLWEMCGRRWWDERLSRRHRAAQSKDEDQGGAQASEGEAEGEMPEWWRPIHREGRFWERPARAQGDVDPPLSPSDWHWISIPRHLKIAVKVRITVRITGTRAPIPRSDAMVARRFGRGPTTTRRPSSGGNMLGG
jgi:predicted ATPase